jgi:hypothetical protein
MRNQTYKGFGQSSRSGAIAKSVNNMDKKLVQSAIKKKVGLTEEQLKQDQQQENSTTKVTSSAIDANDTDSDAKGFDPEFTGAEVDLMLKAQIDPLSREIERLKQEAEANANAIKQQAAAEKAVLEAEIAKQKALRVALTQRGVAPVRHSFDDRNDGSDRQTTQSTYIVARNNFSAEDTLKESMRIFDNTPKININTDSGVVAQSSDQELIALMGSRGSEERQNFKKALQLHATNSGLLRGSQIMQAGTATGDLTPFLLKGLSLFMRTTMTGKHNWQQFVTTKVGLGKNRGEAIEVPRYAYMNTSNNPADYDLGRDDDITTTKQPVSIGSEPIILGLKGLGKAGLAGTLNAPVSVARFFEATSLEDLIGILQKMLYESYLQFQTAAISTEYDRTTQRYFNNNGIGVTTAATLAANAGGQLTQDFLDYMGAMMSEEVPAYANGKYALQCGPFELLQLRRSLQARNFQMGKTSIEELSQILQSSSANAELTPISGYVGDLGQFMVFETGTIYKMLNAASTVTLGGGAKQVYNAYAFGADAVGHAQAMPFSLIYDSATNFSLRNTVSWASIEQYKAIDVDPTLSAVGQTVRQQQRVFKLACSRTPV